MCLLFFPLSLLQHHQAGHMTYGLSPLGKDSGLRGGRQASQSPNGQNLCAAWLASGGGPGVLGLLRLASLLAVGACCPRHRRLLLFTLGVRCPAASCPARRSTHAWRPTVLVEPGRQKAGGKLTPWLQLSLHLACLLLHVLFHSDPHPYTHTKRNKRQRQAMSTPTGRPPPSPHGTTLASPRVGGLESKHTPMHQAAEQGRLQEMQKAAAHNPSSVASKGHMGVSM